MKQGQPWARCTQCGAAYGDGQINQRCSRKISGKRCAGMVKSELRPDTWHECSDCRTTGRDGDKPCTRCLGDGWIFDPRPGTRRVVVHSCGAETDPIKYALAELQSYLRSNQEVVDVALFIPTKRNLDRTTAATVLGDDLSKTLRGGGTVRIEGAAQLRLCTKRTIQKSRLPQAVLVVYADDEMLDLLERAGAVRLIVAVPWNLKLMGRWYREHQPFEVGTPREPSDS